MHQMIQPEGMTTIFGVVLGTMLFLMLAMLAVNIVICLLLFGCFKRIPREYRKMEPGLVWLLLIPCFNLIWNFFVFPGLSRSFRAYFDSLEQQADVGDCGLGIAWAFAICTVCVLVPGIGWVAGPAALVLLIIYLVKANDLKNRIPFPGVPLS